MATAPTMLSIDEYLRTSYHPDADYVDGEIEERNLGEFEHATFKSAISGWFWPRRYDWGIRPVTEQRMRVAPRRIRVCDIALLRVEAPRERVTETPPLLCIEILSPEDRIPRAKVVLSDYLAMGVQNIWLIDPIRRAAFTFDASGLHEADLTRLTVPNSPIHLDLTEAFDATD
jgi:Uma2 family endonuclease